ncbi:MAG: TIR domain-containing protein [Parvularculaceae bacterium]
MSTVFLSYSREDQPRVALLAAALESAGFDVWWDRRLPGGVDFSKETEAQLEKAGAVVVAWSEVSVSSSWVADEATVGREKGILVPIALDASPPKIGFRQFQTIDFSTWTGAPDAPELQSLVAALKQRLTGEPAPSPALPVRRTAIAGIAPGAKIAALVGAVLIAAAAYFGLTRRPAAPAPAAQQSVAVLPFLALSSGADDGYFADGLTEEILNSLTNVSGLLVTARTSAFHFKGKDLPVPEIAATLGVAHVVEGSVRRSAGRARITVQLIRASDGFHLWSETYDTPLSDVFTAQSQMAQRIAEALGVLLDDRAREKMTEASVRNVDAFVAYQKGAKLYLDAHAFGPLYEGLLAANIEFDKAIALEPDFADARLYIADLHFHVFDAKVLGFDLPEMFASTSPESDLARFVEGMDAASRHARTPGRRLMAEYALTLVSNDWSGLGAKMDAALASEECIYPHWIGDAVLLGRADAALAFAKRRNACDPFDPGGFGIMAFIQTMTGDFDDARATLERATATVGMRPPFARNDLLVAALQGNATDFTEIGNRTRASGGNVGRTAELILLLSGKDAKANLEAGRAALSEPETDIHALSHAAWTGDLDAARTIASRIDQQPFGHLKLINATELCLCGAPFPLEATPNFASQLKRGDIPWPPKSPIEWPLKSW